MADNELEITEVEKNGKRMYEIKGGVRFKSTPGKRTKVTFNTRATKIRDERDKIVAAEVAAKNKLIKPKEEPKEEPKIEESNVEEVKIKYNKTYLKKLSFKNLRKIGYELGTKGRGKKELIKEILELQGGR